MVGDRRLLQPTQVSLQITQLVVRPGVVGLELHGGTVCHHRVLQLALFFEYSAQVIVRLGVAGLERQRAVISR